MAGNAAVLRPFEKIPALNVATVLLVGSEESHRELIANAMLKERTDFAVKIHMTTALPLPFEREHLRPRFDMIVFLINLNNQYSMASVTSSIALLDAHFFLGKVCFLSTKGRHGKIQHCLVDISTVKDLADKYLSPLIQTELENEDDVMCTAKRLLNMLKICAGLVPGISSLYTGTIRKYV
ncbi:centromere protein M isoform X1 [Hyla sarda]|uniref:centromere protein M isoform X1 n=1 Tax=Hyla sarda TaxID=327740 RepID=UPI0024C46274|nr:centromere protein M isoform X1 [Hyla sarda]